MSLCHEPPVKPEPLISLQLLLELLLSPLPLHLLLRQVKHPHLQQVKPLPLRPVRRPRGPPQSPPFKLPPQLVLKQRPKQVHQLKPPRRLSRRLPLRR